EITFHTAYQNGEFTLTELFHNPRSVLMEKLDIESATCIISSDKERYLSARSEERLPLEIPLPRSTKSRRLLQIEELEVGSRPFVVPDECYSSITGLHLQKIDS